MDLMMERVALPVLGLAAGSPAGSYLQLSVGVSSCAACPLSAQVLV